MRSMIAFALVLAGTARAEPTATTGVSRVFEQIVAGYGNIPKGTKPPRFAMTNTDTEEQPGEYGSLLVPTNAPTGKLRQPVVAVSADGTGGWGAGDITPTPCQRGALPDDSSGDSSYYEGERCMWEQKGAFARAVLVVEKDHASWQPVAWHIYGLAPGYVGAAPYKELKANVAAGARDVEALFEASIADPKALAKTLSPRAETLLFGSASGERYVGAKQIAATLAKWNLAFKLRGGTVASTAGSSVAWIAAYVEGRAVGKPNAKVSLYRVLFVYEKTSDGWHLVQASFSDAKQEG